MQSDISTAVDGLSAGMLDAVGLHNEMARALALYHSAAYFAGSGKDRLDDAATRMLKDRLKEQVDFLTKFTLAVERGELSDAGIRARALLYAGSIRATYSQALHFDLPLPYHPGDGSTPCGGLCHCRWDVTRLSGEGNADARWVLGSPASGHCRECPARAGQVYRIRGGVLR